MTGITASVAGRGRLTRGQLAILITTRRGEVTVHMDEGKPEMGMATDAEIDDAVQYADPMVLSGVLYQLTGDEELLDVEVNEMVVGGRGVVKVANQRDVARIRAKGSTFLKSYRDAGAGELPSGPPERLQRSLSLTVGVDVDGPELEMWLEELALDPWARGLVWSNEVSPAEAAKFSVVVIGTGMGGLNAAVQLKHAGIPFTVLEKNANVGGTWHENRYPGARVDSPSRTYSHIYGVDFPRDHAYSPQSENAKYFNWVADTFDVRGCIEFHTEVKSVIWDDAACLWEITADQPDGLRTWRANAVISAVGFLSRPNIPDIEGLEDFRGECFHTARWPAELDLSGKRVAVIGTGCTGYQMIPEIVSETEHTYVFQRTPNWVFEIPGYLAPFPAQVSWLNRNFPYMSNFARLKSAFATRSDSSLPTWQIDPDFQDEHAVSAINKEVRDMRMAFLESKLGHRPDLLKKMIPKAPPHSARPVLVDRDYCVLDALVRDDVTLVTDGIGRVTEDGIDLPDGTHYEVDVIVMATGFKANDFLWPMDVRGRDGLSIGDLWAKDGARAYIGAMMPGFPNFFMLYGPNTNQLTGLLVVGTEEITTRFALENIGAVIERGKQAIEVTEDAYWRYNEQVDRAERHMTYLDKRADNYYRNEFGRSAANGPLDSRLLWSWLLDPAERRGTGQRPDIDASLIDQYRAIDPHLGADLMIS
jgi:4-hydroxyacetophenone monooxygenase